MLVALALGFRESGEGATFSSTAAAASSQSLTAAFGFATAAAFVLRKALEPVMVGAAYWIYAKDMAPLVVFFSIPGLFGAAMG